MERPVRTTNIHDKPDSLEIPPSRLQHVMTLPIPNLSPKDVPSYTLSIAFSFNQAPPEASPVQCLLRR